MQHVDRAELVPYFIALIITFALRAVILWLREKIGFKAGRLLRNHMRQKILDKIHQVGPATINNKPAGSWASIMLEQVENLHNFAFLTTTKFIGYCTNGDFNCRIPTQLGGWTDFDDHCTACTNFYDSGRDCRSR